ncbi:hypothetical protein RGI145_22015 [Roseomonas gilardii]|uniref:Uncharacterized protein n=1 Tax=Roseomonas gilardii TaxID=257708 RepID=A0A1L7AMH1_9PROT|nr:hypothetical protein [Roseomonas gilardii]APT59970.1 hypothetical protein RGI145_22015 [Roseomonas gilardii]
MSSMISKEPEHLAGESFPRRHQDIAGLASNSPRWLGRGAVVMATLCLLFAWSFVGSLLMGLRTPVTTQPRLAMLWAVVAMAIVLGGFVIELLVLARPDE